jgi:hypothetical protein
MNLPNLSIPVKRNSQTRNALESVQPSGACEIACSLLPWPASTICKAAC